MTIWGHEGSKVELVGLALRRKSFNENLLICDAMNDNDNFQSAYM